MPRASTTTVVVVVLVVAAALPVAAFAALATHAVAEEYSARLRAEEQAEVLAHGVRVAHALANDASRPAALERANAPPGAFLLASDGTRTDRTGTRAADPAFVDAVGTRVSGVTVVDGTRYAWARVAGEDLVLVAPAPTPSPWTVTHAPWLAAGTVLTTAGLAAGAIGFTRARVTRPLARVADATDRIASGARDERVPEDAGTREIARLARAFNHMADAIAAEEAALAHANARLESVAAARQDALRDAVEDLHAYQFTVDHELREPLRSVSTLLDLWIEEVADALGAEERGVLERVLARTSRLQRVIVDLQAHDQWARRSLVLHDVPLDACVDEALARLNGTVERAGAHVDRSGPLPTVRADQEALVEVLTQVVENAVTFNDADTPHVVIRALPTDEGVVRVAVDDNGIGVPEGRREDVFHAFQRLHPPDRYGGGTGIGLAIARRLARAHDGDLTLTTSPLGGTRAVLALAARGPREREPAPEPRVVREW